MYKASNGEPVFSYWLLAKDNHWHLRHDNHRLTWCDWGKVWEVGPRSIQQWWCYKFGYDHSDWNWNPQTLDELPPGECCSECLLEAARRGSFLATCKGALK